MDELGSSQRSWRALRPAWLVAWAAVSPIIPSALSAPVVWFAMEFSGHPWPPEDIAGNVARYLVAVDAWALIVGLPSLWVMSRLSDRLSRNRCLVLGAMSAFTYPFAGMMLDGSHIEIGVITFVAVIGLVALPFGVLGGWIFWRLAVHPVPSIHRL